MTKQSFIYASLLVWCISLTVEIPSVYSSTDSDSDGMPDQWESLYGLNVTVNDADLDADSDGLTNLQEYTFSTNPTSADTDNDGLSDLEESQLEFTAGQEFQINSYTNSTQDIPLAASDGSSYFVAWHSAGQDGSDYGLFGQLLDVSGNKIGNELQINTYTDGWQGRAYVASNGSTYFVAWDSENQDSNTSGVYGQLLDGSGAKIRSEFRINSYTMDNQSIPCIASCNSEYFATWQSNTQDGNSYGIFGRFFDASGNSTGSEFRINTYTIGSQSRPFIATDGIASYFVEWTSYGQIGADHDMYAQRYDASGTKLGSEFQINTYTPDSQLRASVASRGSTFFAIWESVNQDGANDGVYGQMFGSSGNKIGNEFRINTYTHDDQNFPRVASNGTSYLVVWQSEGQDGDDTGIFAQLFDAAGNKAGNEFRVNTYTDDTQYNASVTSNGSSYLVTWASNVQDGSGYGIFGKIITPANSNPLNPDTDNDGLFDGAEIALGTDPLDADTDGDGHLDGWEVDNGLNPLFDERIDSDNDGLPDDWENDYGLNPSVDDAQDDPDNDGLTNGAEYDRSTDPTVEDTDGDGLPDGWEVLNNLNPVIDDSSDDPDNDGLTNLYEFNNGLDAFDADTDNDGFPDGWEVNYDLDPLVDDRNDDRDNDGLTNIEEFNLGTLLNTPDTDGDGLTDGDELNVHTTLPDNPDTDGDGLPDGWEVTYGVDPLSHDSSIDSDNDGMSNLDEYNRGIDPFNIDSDNDGMTDGFEYYNNLDLKTDDSQLDADGDNLSNIDEFTNRTDPNNPDSDDDGLSDGDEIAAGTNPLSTDTDNDGMPDRWEVTNNLNPSFNDASDDADGDTLANIDEMHHATNPHLADSDSDTITDGDEVHQYFTNPNLTDSDYDGLSDPEELDTYHTDPLNPDMDGDRILDGDEISNATDPFTADATYEVIRQSAHYTILPENNHSSAFTKSMHYDIFTHTSAITDIVAYGSVNPSMTVWFDGLVNRNSDSDRMPDWWELFYGLLISADDANGDPDSDTLINLTEYLMDMNPTNNDTDGDSLSDDWEFFYGTDPIFADSHLDYDNDLVTNLAEKMFATDPLNPDTDGDGTSDGQEILSGLNPAVANRTFEQAARQSSTYSIIGETLNAAGATVHASDTYDQLLSAIIFYAPLFAESSAYRLEPGLLAVLSSDSDNDGMWDSWELFAGTDPFVHDATADPDNDTLTNIDEFRNNTLPHNADSDNDGQNDWFELYAGTNPLDAASRFGYTITTDADQFILLQWPSTDQRMYTIYMKQNLYDEFTIYKQHMYGAQDQTIFIDIGSDANRDGDFDDVNDIEPSSYPSVNKRFYKVIVE